MDETNRSRWRPLTFECMPPEVRQQMDAECPDGSIIRAWIAKQIEAQLSINFMPNDWTAEQLALVQKWLWFQYEQGDFLHRKHFHLETILHTTLAAKVWTLGQRRCFACSGSKPSDKQFPVYVIPIRIEPESRQSLNNINWRAFQAAIRARFPREKYDLSKIDRFCLAFTFGLRISRNDRDLDNMAKALQDAFSYALGFNDKHVHHLDLLKIIGDFREEYVIVRVAPSYLNDHSDTITKRSDQDWAGQSLLRLEDFRTGQ